MPTNKHRSTRTPHPEVCGFVHDSITERDYCDFLHLMKREVDSDIVYIEVFPVVMIQKGERWKLDFCVYRKVADWRASSVPAEGSDKAFRIWRQFIDVKGYPTRDFKRKMKVFNREHPDAPLRVVKRLGKGWEVTHEGKP